MVKSVDGTATYDTDVPIPFFFNDTATTEIYTLSLHDALPICIGNATVGDPSASGQLTAHDVDSGEDHFQTPGSLSGNYGTYTFNPTDRKSTHLNYKH